MVRPYIFVDITLLENTASAVDRFLRDYVRLFGGMNQQMYSLSSSWIADDYTKFMQQWRQFYSGNSIGVGMRREFNSYKDYLEYAASQYRKCQTNAYERACGLR